MVNVLPPEELRDVWRFYRARFVLVFSLVMIGCAIIACVALLPSFFMLWTGTNGGSSLPKNVDPEADKAEFAHSRDLLAQLAPLANATSSPTEGLAHLILARPKGITIDRIVYSAGRPSSLIVTGLSDKRETINAFRDALQHDATFGNVNIPISDLVGATNGKFTITLTGTF